MTEHGHTFVFLTTLLLCCLVLVLVRNRRIAERFALLWLAISLILLVASSIGYPYLFEIAAFVGVPYPPSALFFIAIVGLMLLILQLFVWISKLNDRSRILAQQMAIMSEKLERNTGQIRHE
jgi:hypothetical protein